MNKKSIFSYDKEPRCEYCRFSENEGEALICTLGGTAFACESFRYDVFKRKPRHSPKLQEYDAEEFML